MQNKVRHNCNELAHKANAMSELVEAIKENTYRLGELHAVDILTLSLIHI